MVDLNILARIFVHAIKDPVENSVLSNYYAGPKTRRGYPYSSMSGFLRVPSWLWLFLSFIGLMICIFDPGVYSDDGGGVLALVIITAVMLILFLASLFLLRYKNTIKGSTLVVRRIFTKRRIPLEELRAGALRKPPEKSPLRYPGSFTFATNGKDIHIACINSKGGIQMVRLLCHYAHVPLPAGYSEMAVKNRLQPR